MISNTGLTGSKDYVTSNSFDDEMDIMIMVHKDLDDAIADTEEYQMSGSVASPFTESSIFDDINNIDLSDYDSEVLDVKFAPEDGIIGGTEYNAAVDGAENYIRAYEKLTGGMMDDDDIISMVIATK